MLITAVINVKSLFQTALPLVSGDWSLSQHESGEYTVH